MPLTNSTCCDHQSLMPLPSTKWTRRSGSTNDCLRISARTDGNETIRATDPRLVATATSTTHASSPPPYGILPPEACSKHSPSHSNTRGEQTIRHLKDALHARTLSRALTLRLGLTQPDATLQRPLRFAFMPARGAMRLHGESLTSDFCSARSRTPAHE